MSLVKANTYQDASGGSNAVFSGVASPPNSMGFRNRIINGNMVIDQRNAGASVTPTDGQYLVDRWSARQTTASKFSAQQNSGSVTPPAGYTNYLGMVSLSAYSVSASDIFSVRQKIEGFNVADLAWGTASAQTVTLSFWVRSSLTGTFGGALYNSASTRSYPFSYTISAANTWEFETITIAGDTTGTWLTTSSTGVEVNFGLGVGSTFSGTAGAWAGSDFRSATGATSVVGTNGATFYITGVQLEAGTVASPFEQIDYGRELIMCQRYFVKTYGHSVAVPTNSSGGFLRTRSFSGTYSAFVWLLPVSMRTAPTAVIYNQNTSAVNSWRNLDASTDAAANVSTTGEQSITVESSALVAGATYAFQLTGSAEL
jgi:hypothetical protein